MKPIKSHRDLLVWQRAMDLVVMCDKLTDRFPASEQFGLAFQIRKSSVSIPSNTAGGYQRRSTGAYLQHLSIASGSQVSLEPNSRSLDDSGTSPRQKPRSFQRLLARSVGYSTGS